MTSRPALRVLGDERALDLAGLPGAAPPDAPAVSLGGQTPYGGVTGVRPIAPWPARDELFELEPAPRPLALVVGESGEVAEKLAARGLPAAREPHLTAAGLARASVVILLGPADAATDEEPLRAAAMPAEAPAVLAARRVLIAPRCDTSFGLLPGTDHLAFSTGDDAVQYADAVLSFPESFAPFRVLGAVAAEAHRASRVYARIADELAP